ncbi:MAG TPA: hypothetical protein VJP85_07075 [Candidatus Baltobacteraceae bacterium]|nr:hypothetical protein [Candidatus Baltobacteraceae bacterium]
MDHLTPLDAATARDPYPYYARLVRERPFYFEGDLGMWIASSARAVETVLLSDAMLVRPQTEPVPAAIAGTSAGALFGRFMRVTEGEHQARLKRAALGALNAFAAGDLLPWARDCAARFPHRTADAFVSLFTPFAMAHALGLHGSRAHDAARAALAFAREFSSDAADALVAMLAEAVDRGTSRALLLEEFIAAARGQAIARDALIANAVALLFQSCDAGAGLIGNTLLALAHSTARTLDETIAFAARYDSPVQNTRRYAARDARLLGNLVCEGQTVLVLIAAANHDPAASRSYTFGIGPHACPAERIAHAIAHAAVKTVVTSTDPSALRFTGYHPLPNVRIPVFAEG